MKNAIFSLLLVVAMLTSCGSGPAYKIGVSQCAGGVWREKVNKEMLAAQHLYPQNVEVSIADAEDDVAMQIRQIDSLSETGIDLLVVAPSEAAPVAEAIDRVRSKGISVIFFDRRANTDNYTAFIGGDNVDAGRTIAEHIVSNVGELAPRAVGRRARLLEITGLMTSSPAQERHKGFSQVLASHAEIDYTTAEGDWSRQTTQRIMRERHGEDYDIIFCHSDGMAGDAYDVLTEDSLETTVSFLGIDGMPGAGGGIDCVQRGRMAATYIYPTHGEEIVKLAIQILSGGEYERDNVLSGMIVHPGNADITLQTSDELMSQMNNLVTIHDKLEDYYHLYNTQQKLTLAAVVWALLLVVVLLLGWRAYVQMRRTLRDRQAMNEEEALFYTNADGRRLRQVFEMSKEEMPPVRSQDTIFAETLNEAIRKNMQNPNLKMDDLGEQVGLSRVQLYRKVKAITGLSPVELLRQMRLQRAYVLLTTTTKTVGEVAYEVGFGTPSYFSRCFKQQFGKYPTELRT